MKFVKIKWDKTDDLPCWWEYNASTPLNNATLYSFGFGYSTGYDLTGYEIVEANYLTELNWEGTKVLSDSYTTGWLSPEGKFYGCDYEYHDKQAFYVHAVSSLREMEDLGFIKLTKRRSFDEDILVLNAMRPTIQQVKWFKDNFIAVNRDEIIERLEFNLKTFANKDEQIF